MFKLKIVLAVVIVATIGVLVSHHQTTLKQTTQKALTSAKVDAAKAAAAELASHCVSNTASQAVVVSISQQRLWACANHASVYDTAVTTGATAYSDGTPTGTWAIYSKQADTNLTGSDSRGSWNDHVAYWMPFYGAYGFHDASWQTFPFGSLTQYQTGGSHGCVHLPLPAMKWLYNWALVGTTVTIQS
jgi:lipoprotein-anchoring transpeptidase ErfK/SrfK